MVLVNLNDYEHVFMTLVTLTFTKTIKIILSFYFDLHNNKNTYTTLPLKNLNSAHNEGKGF